MRYRAGMMSGSLAIQNQAGGGTAVVCTVPFASRKVVKRPVKGARKKA
jgi:nitrate/nitrite-specific signal transduction histidine kinase